MFCTLFLNIDFIESRYHIKTPIQPPLSEKCLFYLVLTVSRYLTEPFYKCNGCVVCGHGTDTYRNKISSIQRRAARIILAKPRGSTKTDIFHDLKWLSFDDMCRYHTALLIYKTVHNLAPIYMNDILT